MGELKKVLQERKVEKKELITREDLDFTNEIFIENEPEINEFLINKSIEAATFQSKASLALGKLFIEVYEKLAGNNRYNGLYEKWIEVNGYNKRTALRHRKRFELYGKVKEEKKGFIATLPVRIIEVICNNDDCDTYISLINEGITKEELDEMVFKTEKEPKVIEYEIDEIETGIIEKAYIFNKLNSETLKNLDEDKKKKIESYLKKIENLLGGK